MYKPLGKFSVGYVDFTYLDASDSAHTDPTKHLVGGIFYPVDKISEHPGLSSQRWIPYFGYAKGFARFVLGMSRWSQMKWWQKIYKSILMWIISSFAYLLGYCTKIPAQHGAEICKDNELPIIFVSHGMGGNRMVQSCMAAELASQGFFVVVLEHADGTASAVRMYTRDGYKWRFFGNFVDAEGQLRILHRLKEMNLGVQLLTEANEGRIRPGLNFHHGPISFGANLKGKLDLGTVTCIGHSFGGGGSCALPLQENSPFCTGIGLDPYWPPVPKDSAVFHQAQRKASLLLIGSQSWNDSSQKSFIKSDKELEKKVAYACSRESGGAGSIWVVMKGVGHASFTDADFLFGGYTEKLVPWGRPKHAAKPAVIIANMNTMILTYLSMHLPLSKIQRERISISSPETATENFSDSIGRKDAKNKSDVNLNASASQTSLTNPSEAWEIISKEEEPNYDSQEKQEVVYESSSPENKGEESQRETETTAAENLEAAMESQTKKTGSSMYEPALGKGGKLVSTSENMTSRACKIVQASEESIYRNILGELGVFSLAVYP